MEYEHIPEDEISKEELEVLKKDRIKKEIKRISTSFSALNTKTKNTVKSLIENAAFMSITLQDLQNKINRDGVTENYKNGANQFGVKKSAEVEVYNAMIKNYSSVIKQITDLVPKEVPKTPDDGFDAFVASR